MSLNEKAFALSTGLVWGGGLFGLSLLNLVFPGYGSSIINGLGSVYIGYNPTLLGGVIGFIWGFVDMAICGYIIAWIYNKLEKKL